VSAARRRSRKPATWRQATAKVPHFCISESPTYTARAVVALAADPDVARWSGQVVSTGQLAPIYGFTDTDGTRPDCGGTWSRFRTVTSRPTTPGTGSGRRLVACRKCNV
jgi:hypothetical protein